MAPIELGEASGAPVRWPAHRRSVAERGVANHPTFNPTVDCW